VYAVAELLLRVGTQVPRLVALVPQDFQKVSVVDEDGTFIKFEQAQPDGFRCIFLPFEDDVRDVEDDVGGNDVTSDQVDAFSDLMSALPLESVEWGYSFPNPALGKFWDYIEKVAYGASDRSAPRAPTRDDTLVDKEAQLQRAGKEVARVRELLPPDDEPQAKRRAGGKAEKAAAWGGGGKKLPEDTSGVDWDLCYDSDTIGGKNQALEVLKMYLASRGLRVGGTKSVLADRISDDIRQRRAAGGGAVFKEEAGGGGGEE
jgi:hypothetical protein